MTAIQEDLMKLYSQRILALAAGIPHVGRLEHPQGSARKRSPLCGSTVTVDLTVEDGKIAETWVNWDMYGMFKQLGLLE